VFSLLTGGRNTLEELVMVLKALKGQHKSPEVEWGSGGWMNGDK
jgi:hypothetical protein